jgi:hypothetical protein
MFKCNVIIYLYTHFVKLTAIKISLFASTDREI